MRSVALPSGGEMPVLGQGTWRMGEDKRRRDEEVAALRLGIELGMTMIDTAEMYGNGGAEVIVGEAMAGRRDEIFLVSKVLPQNASRKGTIAACERSLRHLKTDRIDLYLLHWRGDIPLDETVEAFGTLVQAGKIAHWGVSNFDISDMAELSDLREGKACATNQVLYSLTRRGIEFDLLPWSRKRHVPITAYSPIEQGRILGRRELRMIADRHGVTPAQVALAWVMQQDGVVAIPKASNPAHVRDNLAALDLQLTAADNAELDAAFPPPTRSRPLEML